MRLNESIKKNIKFIMPMLYNDVKMLKLQRISHSLYCKNRKRIAFILESYILRTFKCALSCQAKLPDSLIFPHPIGIVIGGGVIIEDDVTVYQNVTIGRKNSAIAEYPYIGKGSIIYCNATVVGDIKVASNTIIGANTTLLESTEEYGVYVGNPAKKVR